MGHRWWSLVGRWWTYPERVVKTLTTPDRTTIHVRNSGWRRVGIGRSSWKGLSTVRHEKVPVRRSLHSMVLHGAEVSQQGDFSQWEEVAF